MFKWILNLRSRDEGVSALVFKTKAIEFVDKMNVENFKASDGWLDHWRKRFNVSFKTFLVKAIHVLMKWSHLGKKLRYQLSCPNMASTRSTTSTNLACFISLNQISPYIWRMKIALAVNTAHCVWQGSQQLMQLEKNYPCL